MTTEWRYSNVVVGQYGLNDLHHLIDLVGGSLGIRSQGYRDKVFPYCTIPDYPAVVYTAEEQETRDQYLTEQESYKKSMCHKFIMGVEDIDDDAVWQSYLDMMDTYGTDKLIAVYQAAYDRYMGR